jgi:hypothetical protein
LGLAGLYLVPAVWEQRWVDIQQATSDPGDLIENSWLFAHHADPALESHDQVLLKVSLIASAMIAVALAGLLVSWLRGTLPHKHRWWIPLALIPVAVLLLQFPISLPVWNALPKLRFLQFPWRWLVVLEAPMAIFFASAVWPHASAHRWWRVTVVAACAAIFLASSADAGRSLFQQCDDEDAVAGMLDAYRNGTGFAGVNEYAPPGTDDSLLTMGRPAACLTANPSEALGVGTGDEIRVWDPAQGSCDAIFPIASNPGKASAEHLRIAAFTHHPGYLVLRLQSYPAWRVRVNGQLAGGLPRREDGLMAVPVPQGPVNLTVDWSTTGDTLAGRWLSAIALALITSLCLLERKLSPPRL